LATIIVGVTHHAVVAVGIADRVPRRVLSSLLVLRILTGIRIFIMRWGRDL
jgi:hypothetical protein